MPSAEKAHFNRAADREATRRAAQAAAAVVEQVESVGGLDAETRGALYTLLSSLADNKFVLGRHYADWCTGAPMLESAVAAAAMAQDELGHARSFYPLLRGFPESSEADAVETDGWQNRSASAMACLDELFANWSDFVAANLLVDASLTTLLEAAIDSGYEPLRQRAGKIIQEEQAHSVHAEGWLRRMAANDKSRPGLLDSLETMWDHAFTWFGRPDDEIVNRLMKADVLSANPETMREWLSARLLPGLEAAGFAADLKKRSLPWERWDARARRLRQ
jgi:phenylacetate-CoA oxygenase PaaI subunit